MHHLHGTAGQPECHGPQRALSSPIGNLIECCSTLQQAQSQTRIVLYQKSQNIGAHETLTKHIAWHPPSFPDWVTGLPDEPSPTL